MMPPGRDKHGLDRERSRRIIDLVAPHGFEGETGVSVLPGVADESDNFVTFGDPIFVPGPPDATEVVIADLDPDGQQDIVTVVNSVARCISTQRLGKQEMVECGLAKFEWRGKLVLRGGRRLAANPISKHLHRSRWPP